MNRSVISKVRYLFIANLRTFHRLTKILSPHSQYFLSTIIKTDLDYVALNAYAKKETTDCINQLFQKSVALEGFGIVIDGE